MAALNQRTPLGSNDMEKALSAAAASFGGSTKNPRAVVYIGDGSSRANLLSPERFRPLATSLADRHIPVVSYGVGPRVDRQILGLLAQQTGGVVLDEPQGGSAADAGRRLAAAPAATVVLADRRGEVAGGSGRGHSQDGAAVAERPRHGVDRHSEGERAAADRRHRRCPRRGQDAVLDGGCRQEHGRQQLPARPGGGRRGATAA